MEIRVNISFSSIFLRFSITILSCIILPISRPHDRASHTVSNDVTN